MAFLSFLQICINRRAFFFFSFLQIWGFVFPFLLITVCARVFVRSLSLFVCAAAKFDFYFYYTHTHLVLLCVLNRFFLICFKNEQKQTNFRIYFNSLVRIKKNERGKTRFCKKYRGQQKWGGNHLIACLVSV